MKIFKSFNELAVGIGKSIIEVEEAWDKWIGRSYMWVGEVEVKKHVKENELQFITFNNEDNEECKKYMMEYEIQEYVWKVHVDDIECWQDCKVVDITNTRLGIDRATVITKLGTQLSRTVKFVLDEDDEDFRPDGCVYFYESFEEI